MQIKATRRFCVTSFRPRGCAPLRVVVAKSALFRFRLTAKTAHAPLLLLSPHDPLRWARAGAPSRLPRAPAEPIHPLMRLYRFGGAESQNRHPDRSLGTPRRTVIFYPFFSQRWATPFTWPAADRSRPTPSAGTGTWIGEGLPISFRGW